MLETEDSIIIDNNVHDDGINNITNNEDRSINEHKNIMAHYFKCLLCVLCSNKTSCNVKLEDLPVVKRTILAAHYDSKTLFKQENALEEINRFQSYFMSLHTLINCFNHLSFLTKFGWLTLMLCILFQYEMILWIKLVC